MEGEPHDNMKTSTNLTAFISMGSIAFSDSNGNCFSHQIFQQTIADAVDYVLSQWKDVNPPKWEWVKEWNKEQSDF